MTFSDIQAEIADRLNLTSVPALARIGRSINERYKWIVSSCGLITASRGVTTATATIGSRSLVFQAEKVLSVFNPAFTPPFVLTERTFDELRNSIIGSDPPIEYAIQQMSGSTVTVFLGSVPATSFALNADTETNQMTLSGTMVPGFAEDFHDILVYGGMSTELEKMEKYDLADRQEQRYAQRLSDLRFFIAKSAYLDIYQGKTAPTAILNQLV
jgi:hypothetical protein